MRTNIITLSITTNATRKKLAVLQMIELNLTGEGPHPHPHPQT